MSKTIGRPPSLDTHQRKLTLARRDLTWALALPHPQPGRQRQRIRTLALKLLKYKTKVDALTQRGSTP